MLNETRYCIRRCLVQEGRKQEAEGRREKIFYSKRFSLFNRVDYLRHAVLIVAVAIASICTSCVNQFPLPQPPVNTRSNSQPTPRPTAQSPTTAQMEAQVRQQINEIRQKNGLSQLRNNEKLAQVARNYSQQMAQKKFFSHTSPEGNTMVQRVKSAGIFYLMLGENLFMCTNVPQPVPSAVEGWMESPGHRENILRPEYRETGIGVWRKGNSYYITQLFMRSVSLD